MSGESIGGIYNGGHDLVAEDRIYRVSTQLFAPRLGRMMGTMGRRFARWVNPAHGRSFWLSKLALCVSDTALLRPISRGSTISTESYMGKSQP